MSLFFTAIGLKHKPLLWIGVVHLWQNKSGTQFGAYGRWTGCFSPQDSHKLLQINGSQPVSLQQHQLACVSCLPADPKSHTKIDIFSGNNTTKHMTFPKWPTSWHQMVCDDITNSVNPSYCVLEEDSAQIPLWDVVVCGKVIHSIPQGNKESKRTSQGKTRKNTTYPKEAWTPKESGDFRHHSCWFEDLCRELYSCSEHMCEHFCGARGTEHS